MSLADFFEKKLLLKDFPLEQIETFFAILKDEGLGEAYVKYS